MRNEIFENYPVKKAIFTLSIPTILGMLITVVYNIADTYFIGRTGDYNQVAAVSLCMPLFFLFMSLGNLFGVGGATYISRLLGSKEDEKVKHVSAFSIYGALITGIICSIFAFIFLDNILVLLGTSKDTFNFAKQYLSWIVAFTPVIMLQHMLAQIIRSEGAAKNSMIGLMIGTIVNIILDPIMITTLGWGCAGAAIATVIGNLFSVIYYAFYILKGKTHLSIAPRDLSLDSNTVWPVFKIGFPSALNTLLLSIANIILYNFAASYDDVKVAAVGIASKIVQVPRLIIIGLSLGAQPFIGYNYAARNYNRMNNAIKFAAALGIAFGTISFLIIYFSAGSLVGFFIEDVNVIETGAAFVKIYIAPMPVMALLFIFLHTMQAFGKAVQALVLAICRDGLLFLPAIYILKDALGVYGIIWAQPIADILTILLAAAMYISIYRKAKAEATATSLGL